MDKFEKPRNITQETAKKPPPFVEGGDFMKGFYTPDGYIGYVPRLKRYILFATEEEYVEYLS